MKKFIYLVIVIFFSVSVGGYAQSKRIDINSKTIFKDQYGSHISFESFLEMTSGNGYEMKPIFDDSGELIEIFVLKPSVAPNFVPPSQSPPPKARFRSAPVVQRSRTMAQPTAPQFDAYDMQQNYYNLDEMYGKVVVLKFWFAACKPCIDEIPQLNTLVDKYRGNDQVVFLAASTDKASRIQSFLQRMPFRYNIIPDAKKLADKFMVIGYPTHLVINTRGKVEAVYQGVNRNIEEKLTGAIERAMRNEAPQSAFVAAAPSPPPATFASPNRHHQPSPRPTQMDSEIAEKEVFITPQSLIKNEAGEIVPFSEFVKLMNQSHYQLINRRDFDNVNYVLMRKVN